mmetsp:Transcript_18782/g.48204  ORF Transcript_18782/g.48204 Transcript_18782/m.48204 type:complete len:228 (-) Transcript_18782:93-776(-)
MSCMRICRWPQHQYRSDCNWEARSAGCTLSVRIFGFMAMTRETLTFGKASLIPTTRIASSAGSRIRSITVSSFSRSSFPVRSGRICETRSKRRSTWKCTIRSTGTSDPNTLQGAEAAPYCSAWKAIPGRDSCAEGCAPQLSPNPVFPLQSSAEVAFERLRPMPGTVHCTETPISKEPPHFHLQSRRSSEQTWQKYCDSEVLHVRWALGDGVSLGAWVLVLGGPRRTP